MAFRSLIPTPFAIPCSPICPNGVTTSIERLLYQLSRVCEILLDLLAYYSDDEGSHQDDFPHLPQHYRYQPQQVSVAVSKFPRFSLLGLASLLLGMASTLMCFGSFALLLGLMFMPFILFLAFMGCMGILLTNLIAPIAELCDLFPASFPSRTDPIWLKKLGFVTDDYET